MIFCNEKDAQKCIYHISWRYNFGFCCKLDDKCAQELVVGIPGVISVWPDENFESDNKDYGGDNPLTYISSPKSLEANRTKNVKTQAFCYCIEVSLKIIAQALGFSSSIPVTRLSSNTSEKTLPSKFEEFGELVEATEEAAAEALNKMNGAIILIINGWMMVVYVAKTNPPKYSRVRPMPTTT
ncbi:hypothetical protein RJ641_005287 [Dillenia turbinata]|uniref:MORF/ORRM1/DAG-like MORF domain-containing protein n=1 Tax=Dillenia turbinata TaxID=194707 RepID=A0AAN8VKJ3_9MAGN